MEPKIEISSIVIPDIETVDPPETLYYWDSLNTASTLQPLFESFKEAMNQGDSTSKARFNEFASEFIRLYKSWSPRTDSQTKCHPTEICTVFNTWLSIAAQSKASLAVLVNEFLVLEILSRSSINRRALRATTFPSVLHHFLRLLLQQFPRPQDDFLQFALPFEKVDDALFKQCLRLLFTVCEHWLRLPYPVVDCPGISYLLSACDRSDSCEFDFSVETGLLLLYALNNQWMEDLQLMARVVFGSITVRASVSRRIQFDKLIKSIQASPAFRTNSIAETAKNLPEFLNVTAFRMREDRRREILVEILSSLSQEGVSHCLLSILAANGDILPPEKTVSALLGVFPKSGFTEKAHILVVLFLLSKEAVFCHVLEELLSLDALQVIVDDAQYSGEPLEVQNSNCFFKLLFFCICVGEFIDSMKLPTEAIFPLATSCLLPPAKPILSLHIQHLPLFHLWCQATYLDETPMQWVELLTSPKSPFGRYISLQMSDLATFLLRHVSETAVLETIMSHVLTQNVTPTQLSILFEQLACHPRLLPLLASIANSKGNDRPSLSLMDGDSVLISFEETVEPFLTISTHSSIQLCLLPQKEVLLYQEPLQLPPCSAVILQGGAEPVEIAGIEMSLHEQSWVKLEPVMMTNLLPPISPYISVKLEGNPVKSQNRSFAAAIRSLGGVSCLFPLLQLDPDNRDYLNEVLSILSRVFNEASEDDWLLFTELLSSLNPAVISPLLPPFMSHIRSNGSKAFLNPHFLSRATNSLRELGFRIDGCEQECQDLLLCGIISDSDVSQDLQAMFLQLRSETPWRSELAALCSPCIEILVRLAMRGEFRPDFFLHSESEIERAVIEVGNIGEIVDKLEKCDEERIGRWVPILLRAIEKGDKSTQMWLLKKLKDLLIRKKHPFLDETPKTLWESCLHPISVSSPVFLEIIDIPNFELLFTSPKPTKEEWIQQLGHLIRVVQNHPDFLQSEKLIPWIRVMEQYMDDFWNSENTGDLVMEHWSLLRPFLVVVLLFPPSFVKPHLQSLFMKLLSIVSQIPVQEEDLLFVGNDTNTGIPEEVQKAMKTAMTHLVSNLVSVCELGQLGLCWSQLHALPSPIDSALNVVLQEIAKRQSTLQDALSKGVSSWEGNVVPEVVVLIETPVSEHWRETCDTAVTRLILQMERIRQLVYSYSVRTNNPNSPWMAGNDPGCVGISPQLSTPYCHLLLVNTPGYTRHEQASVWNVNTPTTPTPTTPTTASSSLPSKLVLRNQQIAFSASAIRVTPLDQIRGTVTILADVLYFTPDAQEIEKRENQIQQLDAKIMAGRSGENVARLAGEIRGEEQKLMQLESEEFRSYRLRGIAVELFFHSGVSLFFAFDSPAVRKEFHTVIRSMNLPRLSPFWGETAAIRWSRDTSESRWIRGEMTNLEYLLHLNRLAGRSFNDLSQYPIMPWILQDYTSPALNISNPAVFRRLDRPIGMQSESRAQAMQEKYQVMRQIHETETPDIENDPLHLLSPPPRHHSTLPSNAAIVLWYLLRLEPYASEHVILQGGRFDRPDRQCHSIDGAWKGAVANENDCKELLPEWFLLPQVFTNTNAYDLGVLQDSQKAVGDIQLPPWAQNPYDFVSQMQDALESEFVGSHLHHWIDLVFGVNQRGNNAVKAGNVYPHLAYLTEEQAEGLFSRYFDIYHQAAEIVENFGQVPQQVCSTAHKTKKVFYPFANQIIGTNTNWCAQGCVAIVCDSRGGKKIVKVPEWKEFGVISTVVKEGSIFGVTESGVILHFSLAKQPKRQQNSSLVLDWQKSCQFYSSTIHQKTSILSGTGEWLLTCVFGGIRLFSLEGQMVETWKKEKWMKMVVSEEDTVIAVSDDDEVIVSCLRNGHLEEEFEFRVKSNSIVDVSVSVRSHIVGVLGTDRRVHLFSLFDGSFLRTVGMVGTDDAVDVFCVTPTSSVLMYSSKSFMLQHCDQLGVKICEAELHFEPDYLRVNKDCRTVVIEGERGVEVRELRNLRVLQ